MPVFTKGNAAQSSATMMTREDLRSELQGFLTDVRREVSDEVCQSLLPQLRQLIADSRAAGAGFRGSVSRRSIDETAALRTPKYRRESIPSQSSIDDEKKTKTSSSSSSVERKFTNTKSAISFREMEEEAKKRTMTAHVQNSEDKSYVLLGADSDCELKDSAPAGRPSRDTTYAMLRRAVKELVKNSLFEQGVGFTVLLNALSLGYDTQYWADHRNDNTSPITRVTEVVFCILFSTELSLRLFAYGCYFFQMETWCWNIMDTFLVVLQLSEQILRVVSYSIPLNLGVLRLLRIMRIIRVTRLVRSFHLFDDLRVIASSIMNSAPALMWSLILLGIVMYIFSLVFLQIVLNAGETEHAETLDYWFGSLNRTYFTMFECIAGGVSWDEVTHPLWSDIGPFAAYLFAVYIACSLFAMMNLLTGVFVDKAMKTVREDKDVVLAKRIRDLFLGRDPVEKEEAPLEITWEMFQRKLETNVMQDYLKQINVELTQGRALFALLDADGSGAIDSDEIVEGCLKLRGPSRALDLALLSRDIHSLTIIANEVKLYMTRIMTEIFTEEVDEILYGSSQQGQSHVSE